MYPRLVINESKLIHNAKTILDLCHDHALTCFLVGKVVAGNKEIIKKLSPLGFSYLTDSRIENLRSFKDINIPKALLRIPMLSEVKDLVKYTDLCLVSELPTIKKINLEAKKQNKIYNIILMIDLGDLREGIFYESDYLSIVDEILKLENVNLKGIGNNLTCYGGIIPDEVNLGKFCDIATEIEEKFNISLDIISGGNSSTLYMLDKIPKKINNLRIGEAIFLGKETAFGTQVKGCYLDAFVLEAEFIEVQYKPSYPIGTMQKNAFGEIPQIEDEGWMMRGILAIGKQDVYYQNLICLDENIKILDSSSDHLIVAIKNGNYKVGDKLSFIPTYGGLLQLMTSKYVHKVVKRN